MEGYIEYWGESRCCEWNIGGVHRIFGCYAGYLNASDLEKAGLQALVVANQASKQAGRQAGKQASRQACRQAGTAAGRQAGRGGGREGGMEGGGGERERANGSQHTQPSVFTVKSMAKLSGSAPAQLERFRPIWTGKHKHSAFPTGQQLLQAANQAETGFMKKHSHSSYTCSVQESTGLVLCKF